MFKSKRISLLTIFALLLPSVGIASIGSTAAYASTSTELSVFTVNGTTVADGDTVNLDPYTTSVEVVATAADPTSTVEIAGGTDLATGPNDLVVTVTDTAAASTQYTVNLNVLASNDTSAVITINDEEQSDGDNYLVPWGTDSVSVSVVTGDSNATYFVNGDLGLVTGDNELTVLVTAADGLTQQTYTFNVLVLLNTDTSTNFIKVGDVEVFDGDTLDLEPLTTDVGVDVDTVDTDATVEIVGGTEMVTGENTLTIYVTAADGETVREITITLNVLPNTDTSLLVFNVAGVDVADADFVTVEPLTTEVEVLVETTDPEASYEIEGGTDLVPGENDLTVTVTAADQETVTSYFVTIVVAPNTDTSIESISVNGEETADGGTVYLDPFTEEVEVEITLTDPNATYLISGNDNLLVGDNTMTIIVVAADEETFEEFTVTLVVAPSNDASVAGITITYSTVDGEESTSASADDVIDLPAATESVSVLVETTDLEATFEVSGTEGLELGENTLTIRVTAPDGETVEEIYITLNVLTSSDATAASITFNGVAADLENLADGVVEVDAGDINVEIVPTNEFATGAVTNGVLTNFSGVQTITVEITAQDGETKESYDVTVVATSEMLVVPGSTLGDGELRVGTWIKLPRDQFDKSAKLTYMWFRNWEDEPFLTGTAKYKLTVEDFGANLRAVVGVQRVGQPDLWIISKQIEVLPGIIAKAPTPAIKGKAAVGNTLTATTRDWPEGAELVYQWYRDGSAIDGADTDSYELTAEDFDASVSVGITGTIEAYEPLEKVSAGVTIAAGTLKYGEKPSISGDFVTGGTVTVGAGTWLDGAEVSIVWMRNGEEFQTTGADENSYVLTSEDFGTRLSVNIVVTAEGYKDAIFKMRSRSIKLGTLVELPAPVISGDAVVGETLEVDLTGLPEDAEFSYVWKRNGKVISRAFESSYTLTARDLGQSITVKVGVRAPGYKKALVESESVTPTNAVN